MHNFDIQLGEEILYKNEDNNYIMRDNSDEHVATVLTNKRLLMFINIDEYPDYKKILESRGIDTSSIKELIMEISLDDIVKIEKEEKYDKYILNDNNCFYITDKEIGEKISK